MDTILFPIKWVIAWIMYGVHKGFTAIGLPDGPGIAWVLSIVGLTIVVRILILPLFKKQIESTRATQIIQPKIKKLQAKYKGKTDTYSRQRMQAEMQAIYRDAGTSPFATCLPLLIQMPIFFALFRVLTRLGSIANGAEGIGPITTDVAGDIEKSVVFGAPLSASFNSPELGGGDAMTVRIVAGILTLVMTLTMFYSQKLMIDKNLPEDAKSNDNPMYRTQKMMMYIFPFIFVFSGVAFPIGVLVYWVISNLWSTGQQLYMLAVAPAPGSDAYIAKKKRDREKLIKAGLDPDEVERQERLARGEDEEEETVGQRRQPVGKNRAKKKGLPTQDEVEAVDETPTDDVQVDKGGLTPEQRAAQRAAKKAEQRRIARQKRNKR